MAGFDFERLMAIARGEHEGAPTPETQGSLALSQYLDNERSEPPLQGASYDDVVIREDEKVLPLFSTGVKFQKKGARGEHPCDCILRAFKRTCEIFSVSFSAGEDEQGRSRVILKAPSGYDVMRYCLSVELEYMPWLEATLLLELARKDAGLMDIIEERAAILAAEGLQNNLEDVALLMIGARERMAEWEADRAEFKKSLQKRPRKAAKGKSISYDILRGS